MNNDFEKHWLNFLLRMYMLSSPSLNSCESSGSQKRGTAQKASFPRRNMLGFSVNWMRSLCFRQRQVLR
ncbi:MAG: hypothetical protein A3F84_00510 [Candidatus Handelsmanbacteria bacterium RIFCSPLOWO2_12_FULL_64_10]|uniref:Uncharacterized protein n=1 Tax=Handelsmanbacteria sp. (strain RIFCSPLOWO2_12_FULL_64_10) TaxID=1817868 RepID=A0A1F6C6T1_HANXR|nr:MAG: hypothetical protein A3F84_00510 [Candidatus Handelsmanbacteria bacterium RIFCSPLOWO2_12_FULL_64_10]